MGKKQLDQVIALINAALRNGQPQSWMYESLGIAMELDGRSKTEIERAVMSAADFSTSADELMYIAKYTSRIGLDRRSMLLYQQVVKIEPLRSEAYALGLRAAERCDDIAGIRWATVGILSQAWPNNMAQIETTASRTAKATLERLASEGHEAEQKAFLKDLQEAVVRDCVVRVSWTGDADIDVSVEEPSGTVCSASEPRTIGGGVSLGDSYSVEGKSSEGSSEVYVCPKGFGGKYRVRIHRVWGEVAAGKVTVDVYTHLALGRNAAQRQQLEISDKDAMVVFDLNHGRRSEPLESAQLAGAVKRQEILSRSVLAQQIADGSDPSAASGRPLDAFARRAAFLGGARGAVGFQPIIQTLPEGTMMSATAVVSADRRYVRVAVRRFSRRSATCKRSRLPAKRQRRRLEQGPARGQAPGGAVTQSGRNNVLRFGRQQPDQDALLHVHPVRGLRDDDAVRAVDHFVGNFFAAMRRQAVQEERVFGRCRH